MPTLLMLTLRKLLLSDDLNLFWYNILLCLIFFYLIFFPLTQQISYKYLIIALGISLHYEKVFILQ